MEHTLSPLRRFAIGFAVWTAVGLVSVQAAATSLAVAGKEMSWRFHLVTCLASVWIWALYTPLIMAAARRWPVLGRGRRLRNFAPHVLMVPALTALDAWLLTSAERLFLGRAVHSSATSYFLSALTLNLISYAVVTAVGSAGLLMRQLRDEEARSARLASQLTTAQLSALRAQLHPHFFFNTLNAIAELIHRDADAADRMVTRLGAFLRRSLDVSERQEIALEEEVEALEAYLDVVRLRFRDRVSVAVEVDPDALSAPVPPLVLQPLVENALKHGLEPKEGPGRLEVAARLERGRLVLEVRDDGVGLPASGAVREGIGVRNTRDRLRQLYGPAAGLSLEPRPGGGTVATVLLPLPAAVAGSAAR